ncbi:MAG TPA: DICT sensory domain-containing protein [Nonomuraea sp.]|nr:DICT sensory domain-containing protein [Nonomuraea sp.]
MTTPATIIGLQATDSTDVKTHLLALSRSLEARIGSTEPTALVVATLQTAGMLTGRTREAFERIAASGAATYLAGTGTPAVALPGVTWIPIPYRHPLRQEWTVIIIRERDSVALVSREIAPPLAEERPADAMRRFHWRMIQDPALVLRCANAVIDVRHSRAMPNQTPPTRGLLTPDRRLAGG